jgi:hypothetical protein
MSYRVIHKFVDLQDFGHLYRVGDKYPRLGMNVKQSRIDELASNKNRAGEPLIALSKPKADVDFTQYMNEPIADKTEKHEYTKTEINRTSTSDLRIIATEQGIDNAEELTGAELKKLLIEKLGL